MWSFLIFYENKVHNYDGSQTKKAITRNRDGTETISEVTTYPDGKQVAREILKHLASGKTSEYRFKLKVKLEIEQTILKYLTEGKKPNEI